MTPHLTSQMRCKEVVNAFRVKCVLELDVLMTEQKKKKDTTPSLGILTHLCFSKTFVLLYSSVSAQK